MNAAASQEKSLQNIATKNMLPAKFFTQNYF